MRERVRFEAEVRTLLGHETTFTDSVQEYENRSSNQLPLLLAGPIVRRATPEAVWFWFACSKEVKSCTTSLIPYNSRGEVQQKYLPVPYTEIPLNVFANQFRTVRLGENIWIVLVAAVPKDGKFPTDVILGYDLSIETEENGVRSTNKLSNLNLDITYRPFTRPTFVLGAENRKLAHGSCRRPGADAEDAFGVFDEWLAKNASDALARPASLMLTGDQIYADDVAVALFEAVSKIALDVFGYVERIPTLTGADHVLADTYSWRNSVPVGPGMGAGSHAPPPPVSSPTAHWSGRRKLTHRLTSPIGFTTEDGEAHLLSFPEFAAMYLAVWNPELCTRYGVERLAVRELQGFCRAVQASRRVMANMVTYMLCDDHEITDDWNLDQQWEDATKNNRLARRIISNGLAAYWAFQAWGNAPEMFDQKFVERLSLYWEQLRSSKGYPRNPGSRSPYNAADKYEELLLQTHWSFMAPTNPPALCVDTRTRRETRAGQSAILSGKRVWPYLDTLLRKQSFRRGDLLLLVTPTPFLPHRSMMYIQDKEYSFPKDRYAGDFELYGNNPVQRAELVLWLQHHFGPSGLVFFSGDVHHGSVVSGRYAYGKDLDKIKAGKADWAMRIVQITSSPIKNEKNVAYRKKRWWTAWQTDAGNVGESVVPQWEHQYATTTDGTYIAMQAAVGKLSGSLGRQTYIFEPHLCVVDMPSRPKGAVNVLFVGVEKGKLLTANTSVDTDNDPAKFLFTKVGGGFFSPLPAINLPPKD